MDNEEFMRNYIGLLTPRFSHLYSPDKFAKQLLRSTEVMIRDPKPGRTNLQTFFEEFSKLVGISFSVLWPIFEDYYEQDFPNLQYLVKPDPKGKKAVETAFQQGFIVGIAANPVMPLSAMKERVRWTGINSEQLRIVPSIETFHFCKPHPGFFTEVAQSIGLDPSQCLMVGNHPVEDMAARTVGMKTFFVGKSSENVVADYSGGMPDLIKLILQGIL